MENLRIYLLVGWLLIGFLVELYKNPVLRFWIKSSCTFIFDKRRIIKDLESKSDQYKRDYYLDNYVIYDTPKFWFQRSMEKHIRISYIEEINEKVSV